MRSVPRGVIALSVLFAASVSVPAGGAKVKILLPLGRTAYQTNERIDLAVVRSADHAPAAGELTLRAAGADGSSMSFASPVEAVSLEGGSARRTEQLYLNGWLLRPGGYVVDVACDGAAATTEIEVYSHWRSSNFKRIDWGRAKGKAQLPLGEGSLGFSLF